MNWLLLGLLILLLSTPATAASLSAGSVGDVNSQAPIALSAAAQSSAATTEGILAMLPAPLRDGGVDIQVLGQSQRGTTVRLTPVQGGFLSGQVSFDVANRTGGTSGTPLINPEPSSLLLLGTGALLLLRRLKRCDGVQDSLK